MGSRIDGGSVEDQVEDDSGGEEQRPRLQTGQAARSARGKGRSERREGNRTQTHAVSPHVERVRLGRIDKRHGSLTGRVDHPKEVDTRGDAGDASLVCRLLRDQKGEAGEEEAQGHEREGRQKQVAPAKGVDGLDGRDREQKVDDAKAQRRRQRRDVRVVGLLEDVRRIIRDDVDAAELSGFEREMRS